MDADMLLIAEVLASVGGFSFLMVYAAARVKSHRRPVTLEPIELKAKLREDQPIRMPAHLTTRDEMVRWMVRDLPKLTARTIKPERA
jgi:hypothetical protein